MDAALVNAGASHPGSPETYPHAFDVCDDVLVCCVAKYPLIDIWQSNQKSPFFFKKVHFLLAWAIQDGGSAGKAR